MIFTFILLIIVFLLLLAIVYFAVLVIKKHIDKKDRGLIEYLNNLDSYNEKLRYEHGFKKRKKKKYL